MSRRQRRTPSLKKHFERRHRLFILTNQMEMRRSSRPLTRRILCCLINRSELSMTSLEKRVRRRDSEELEADKADSEDLTSLGFSRVLEDLNLTSVISFLNSEVVEDLVLRDRVGDRISLSRSQLILRIRYLASIKILKLKRTQRVMTVTVLAQRIKKQRHVQSVQEAVV